MRRTRAIATSAPRTPWTRQSSRRASRRAPAGLPPRPAERDRRDPCLHRAGRAGRRARARHRLRHAHAPLRHDVPLDRVPPAFLRSERIGSPDGRREAVEAMASYTSILSAGDDWSRIVLLDNEPVAGVRPARPGLDRGGPAADGTGGDLRPPRSGARGARDADGDHPLLHGGPAGGGLPPPSLCAWLRRDDPRARRAARDVLLPRRIHVGGLVPPFMVPSVRCSRSRRPSSA